MKKWAWRICVTTSLLLLVGTVGMWVRAQWATDANFFTTLIGWPHDPRRLDVGLIGYPSSLAVQVDYDRLEAKTPEQAAALQRDLPSLRGFRHYDWTPKPGERPRELARWYGFEFSHFDTHAPPDLVPIWMPLNGTHYRLRGTEDCAEAPFWFLTLLLALAPARALWTWRRKRFRPPHACPACGYDLRATADPAGPRLPTCPECGNGALTARPGGAGG